MPRYTYYCKECDDYFDVMHSMNGEQKECILCQAEGAIEKRPALISQIRLHEKEQRAGSVVEKSIKEMSKDLADEKKRLRSKEV